MNLTAMIRAHRGLHQQICLTFSEFVAGTPNFIVARKRRVIGGKGPGLRLFDLPECRMLPGPSNHPTNHRLPVLSALSSAPLGHVLAGSFFFDYFDAPGSI
jgi:hypothetical protein